MDSEKVGLRLRKKVKQREAILDTAIILFRLHGYDATRMEDIAEGAEVSPKTVYNYFPSKHELLSALLLTDRDKTMAEFMSIVDDPPDDPVVALASLIKVDIGDVKSKEDKRLWLDMMAESAKRRKGDAGNLDLYRRMFTQCVQRILEHFVRRGAVSPEIPLDVAADLVAAINSHNFREYCADESATPDDVCAIAEQHMRLLIGGWSNR